MKLDGIDDRLLVKLIADSHTDALQQLYDRYNRLVFSMSLAWNPSTDNSGSVTYTICCANVSSETFPGPASSRVYRAGLEAGRSFTLRISARDASGNVSRYSNPVTFTLPADSTPPTQPVVSLRRRCR